MSQTVRSGVDGRVAGRARLQMSTKQASHQEGVRDQDSMAGFLMRMNCNEQHVEILTRSGAEPPLKAVREGPIVIVGRRVACGGVVGPHLLGTFRERPTWSVGGCRFGNRHEIWNEREARTPVEQVNSEGWAV